MVVGVGLGLGVGVLVDVDVGAWFGGQGERDRIWEALVRERKSGIMKRVMLGGRGSWLRVVM